MKKTERSGIASDVGIIFTKQDTETILRASQGKLIEIAGKETQLTQYGEKYIGLCPKCKSPHYSKTEGSFTVTATQFTCWSCNMEGASPVSFLMQLGKSYPETLLYLAIHLHLIDPSMGYKELYFY